MVVNISSEIEQAIEEMPTISPIVNKLGEMAQNIETSPTEIVKIIMIDPVLTGKVIELVNSAFYGLTERVHSLPQAILLLGVNTVKNMAMCTAVLDKILLKSKKLPLNPEIFWQHCLGTAVACKMLAKLHEVPQNEQEMYFLAGLLHDVGKVVYMKAVPDAYRAALEESRTLGVSLYFSELSHFGCAHTHVGGLLARKWQLDPLLLEVVENHHRANSTESQSHLLRFVIVANNLCKQAALGEGGNVVIEERAKDLMEELKMSASSLQPVAEQLPNELKKAADFLKVAKGGSS